MSIDVKFAFFGMEFLIFEESIILNVGQMMCLFSDERSITTRSPPDAFGTRKRRLVKQGRNGAGAMIPSLRSLAK